VVQLFYLIFAFIFMRRIIIALVIGLMVPTMALAHPEPIKTPTMYNQSVYITSVTIDDDDNWIGGADVFFDTIVDALVPPHDEQQNTTDTFELSDEFTYDFEPAIEIYSHDTCHCDEEFDIDIALFDYAPIKTALWDLLGKLIDYGKAYGTGGQTGLGIAIISDILEALIDKFNEMGMSDEEAEWQAKVKLFEQSNELGAMREIVDTGCEPADETYNPEITVEEVSNGWLSYRIVKTPLDEVCYVPAGPGAVEEEEEVPEEPPEEPGDAEIPPVYPEDEEKEDYYPEPDPPVEKPSEDTPVEEPTDKPSDDQVEDVPPVEDLPPDDEPIEDVPPEEPVEEPLAECLPKTGHILKGETFVCPTYSYEMYGGCFCNKGYEWSDPDNLCDGCALSKPTE